MGDQNLKNMIFSRLPNQFSSLDCVETTSFHDEEDSYDFDDHMSEVVDLTEEERDCFHVFLNDSQSPLQST